MLIVLATSPRVAPGLLSWPAWEALRSAAVVLVPAGHPQLPALDAAGIAYRVAEEPPPDPDEMVVWLAPPGASPPAGASTAAAERSAYQADQRSSPGATRGLVARTISKPASAPRERLSARARRS